VGTKGTHLTYNTDVNQPIIDPAVLGRTLTPADSATIDARRPFTGLTSTNYFGSGDNSSYNSLQVKLTQRLVKGLTYIAAYTWSISIDMASEREATMAGNNNVRPQDNTNRRADRGVSDFDLTHRFTLSWVYTLPLPRPSSKFLAYLI